MIKTFATPIAAGNYLAGFGTAKGALLHSLDTGTGQVVFSLIAVDDTVAPEVNGITSPGVTEATAAAAIRAAIAAA